MDSFFPHYYATIRKLDNIDVSKWSDQKRAVFISFRGFTQQLVKLITKNSSNNEERSAIDNSLMAFADYFLYGYNDDVPNVGAPAEISDMATAITELEMRVTQRIEDLANRLEALAETTKQLLAIASTNQAASESSESSVADSDLKDFISFKLDLHLASIESRLDLFIEEMKVSVGAQPVTANLADRPAGDSETKRIPTRSSSRRVRQVSTEESVKAGKSTDETPQAPSAFLAPAPLETDAPTADDTAAKEKPKTKKKN